MTTRNSTEVRGLKAPPLRTSFQRPRTAVAPETPTSDPRSPSQRHGTPETPRKNDDSPKTTPGQQRFVLTDPVAFRYLEGDSATAVVERKRELQGYECYVVEQWTTSRSHPTFTITTYTGDPNSVIVVDVLTVPSDESKWSARLRVYFKALNQYHAVRRQTPLGILMVTNLAGFPSSLTVIAVPDGDLSKHRTDFFVNENLKRLNCSGRVGLTLGLPASSTAAKFHQLYRTSDKNEIHHAVTDLVKLCQSALMLFDKLDVDYADGLLCDITERAIQDCWAEIGTQYYNIDRYDGILGPTTVAGLLGLLMGARNRLQVVGAAVPKDPFDVNGMKKAISSFQKQQHMTRTRRLDRRTLDKLHRVTQKAASQERSWGVPNAVKSTVAELSGRGGEMVMAAVGRRDKAGIAEIETCDIERFVQLVYGERAKWLWYGKPLKSQAAKSAVGSPLEFGQDEEDLYGKPLDFREASQGGFTWTARKSNAKDLRAGRKKNTLDEVPGSYEQTEDENEDEGIQGVSKRATGLKDAREGLAKIKGVVGLGHHRNKASKNIGSAGASPRSPASPNTPPEQSAGEGWEATLRRVRSQSTSTSGGNSPRSPVPEQKRSPNANGPFPEDSTVPAYAVFSRESGDRRNRDSSGPPSYKSAAHHDADGERDRGSILASTVEPSVAGSMYNDVELNGALPTGPETEKDVSRLLQRTTSYSRFVSASLERRLDNAHARHLSFSLAEDSVLTWGAIVEDDEDLDGDDDDLNVQLIHQEYLAKESKMLRHMINELSSNTATFTQNALLALDSLLEKLDGDQEPLELMYDNDVDRVRTLHNSSEGMIRAEKERLEEGSKEAETLASKLDYEINALRGRVEDVEAGVSDFERGVRRMEDRVKELEKAGGRGGSLWTCVVS